MALGPEGLLRPHVCQPAHFSPALAELRCIMTWEQTPGRITRVIGERHFHQGFTNGRTGGWTGEHGRTDGRTDERADGRESTGGVFYRPRHVELTRMRL